MQYRPTSHVNLYCYHFTCFGVFLLHLVEEKEEKVIAVVARNAIPYSANAVQICIVCHCKLHKCELRWSAVAYGSLLHDVYQHVRRRVFVMLL